MLRHLGAAVLALALIAGAGSTAHARPQHHTTKHHEHFDRQVGSQSGRGDAIAAEAKKYVGHKPTLEQLKDWARRTGIGVWKFGVRVYCALGVNMVLAKLGVKGSGEFTANSFSGWGSRTRDPQPGDIAITRGGGHVAVVVERDDDTVTVVSFNSTGHRVVERELRVRGVHYRRAA